MSNKNSNPRGTVTSVPPKASPQGHQTTTSKLPPPPPKSSSMSNDLQQRELPKVSKLPPPPPIKK